MKKECPRCKGAKVVPSGDANRSFSDCPECKGTGEVVAQDSGPTPGPDGDTGE